MWTLQEILSIREHLKITTLTQKKVKPKASAVSNHLFCNYSPSLKNNSVLTKENRKFILELKEGLLVMRDKPSLNRKVACVLLSLFERV